MSTLADSPSTIFQTLAETILDITQCDSAGLSLLTRDGKKPDVCGKRFYWPAIAGMWNPHVGGGTPRNFGPCGDVLDQNRTLLFRHFERRYPYLMPVSPAAAECLLVPFYVAGEAVGTIWGIMHSDRRKFDAEDDRVMASLGKFASSAYQSMAHIEDLKFQVSEREKAEAEVRELARGLEAKIRRLVEANVVGIVMWNLEGAITGANEAFLRMVQYDIEDIASGRVRWTELTPAEWRDRDEWAITELKTTGIFQTFREGVLPERWQPRTCTSRRRTLRRRWERWCRLRARFDRAKASAGKTSRGTTIPVRNTRGACTDLQADNNGRIGGFDSA